MPERMEVALMVPALNPSILSEVMPIINAHIRKHNGEYTVDMLAYELASLFYSFYAAVPDINQKQMLLRAMEAIEMSKRGVKAGDKVRDVTGGGMTEHEVQ